MVLVLPQIQKQPGPLESFASGLGQALPSAFQHGLNMRQKKAEEAKQLASQTQQEEALEKLGIQAKGIKDPNLLKALLENKFKEDRQNALLKQFGLIPSQEQIQQNQPPIPKGILSPEVLQQKLGPQSAQQNQPNILNIPQDKLVQIAASGPEGLQLAKTIQQAQQYQQTQDLAERKFKFQQEQNEIDRKLRDELEQKRSLTAKEERYFNKNEPELIKISNAQKGLELEEARLGRLEELFSDPSKIPSEKILALPWVTKEGQINDSVYALLPPEAQEAIKIITDMTSNIKDTYGARVTNLDLQTYLKKLPSLLNSPEGKKRIIRDLQSINEINQLYNKGILDIFDEAGGSDKIPYTTALNRFNKKYGDQIKELTQEFIKPGSVEFKELPNPRRNIGKKIVNTKTGETFISDGNSWKPYVEEK